MTENSIGDVFNAKPRVADPTWLPEPESRERTHLLISVDDHVAEADRHLHRTSWRVGAVDE